MLSESGGQFDDWILIFIEKAVRLKLGKEATVTHISLKREMFGHFCAWDNVLDFACAQT